MYTCSDGFICASKKVMEQREERLKSINPETGNPYTEIELRIQMRRKREEDIREHKRKHGN